MILSLVLALAGAAPAPTRAQASSSNSNCNSTDISENFTQSGTNCSWNWIGGACLTAAPASSKSNTASPGPLPQCVGSVYYGNQTQYGGNSEAPPSPGGTLNLNPDTSLTGGALRLTNDADNQSGAIISSFSFPLASQGVAISFTTETYEGDSGGGNKDGADGISFFLQDAGSTSNPTPVTVGNFGGSLGYTCSNSNGDHHGMVGGYIGLGIDEFGNFLNGTTITNADGTTTMSTGADNTSSGYGYVPNRIGLRGPGSTNWYTMSQILDSSTQTAYYPSTLTVTQQTAAVQQACMTGYVWDYRKATSGITGPTTTTTSKSGVVTWLNPYSATETTVALPNYSAIPNAYSVLTAHKIANESAIYRGYANAATTGSNYGVPITYNLSISASSPPLLSLSYSYNGGNFLPILSGQTLPAGNTLPQNVRFGFAGSTGGDRNIHEIMCFQAQPQNSASSSAGLNQKQSAKVQTGTQVYFAFYNANNWTGDVTSQYLDTPAGGGTNDLQIDPSVNWSATCLLTGGACAKTGATLKAQDPDSGRTILSYNTATGTGIAFTYANLSSGQQANMDFGDLSSTGPSTAQGPAPAARVEYLRGARGDEQTPQGVDPNTPNTNPSGFRRRSSVLGDIVDSSPTWVGPPSVAFPTIWKDYLYPSTAMGENSASTNYAGFQSNYLKRMNVVYTGANDGLLHGFRTGNFTGAVASPTFDATNNDGLEVLAYMPGYVVNTINSSALANTLPATPNPVNDYTNPLYGHKFNVDGTPGTGDLFYGGTWHTWLIGGLGAGGSAIYALDITDPSQFVQTNAAAATLVLGEWQSSITTSTTTTAGVTSTIVTGGTSNITCAGNGSAASNCGNSLGKTFGAPQIRRFHNTSGANTSWGAVFGNGGGSFNGDAGIFIMLVNANSGGAVQAPTFYYLSTGMGTGYTGNSTTGYTKSSSANGIYYVAAADLDGDHVTDYVYAGDLQGNLWRFDLTNSDPTQWGVTQINGNPTPIYTTPGGKLQPITTQPVVATVPSIPNSRILIEFGTGAQTQFTNSSGATYATAQQYLVGVWDWNMASWNAISSVRLASLPATVGSGTVAAPTSSNGSGTAAISGLSQLQKQTITGSYDSTGLTAIPTTAPSTTTPTSFFRTVSANVICWADSAACSGSAAQYGWYLQLSSGYANQYDANNLTSVTTTAAQTVYEQVIFNPTYQEGAFQVNTTIPPTTSVATCSSTSAGGWTMAINPATGGAFTNSYFALGKQFTNVGSPPAPVTGIALNGTGSTSDVVQGTQPYLVTQTINGQGALVRINPPSLSGGKRLTWIQKR
jgi:type IV pilus assembly protein PilY1